MVRTHRLECLSLLVCCFFGPLNLVKGNSYDTPDWEVDDRCLRRRALEVGTNEGSIQSLRGNNKNDRKLQEGGGGTVPPQERLGPFHLKLYWEPWFCWQEEMIERFWCMECQDQICEWGKKLQIAECDKCDVAQRLEYIPSASFAGGQIRVLGTDLCWTQFSGRAHRLEDCRDADKKQIFGGFLADDKTSKFSVNPRNDPGRCMTQHHHPRPTENIHSENCTIAHNTQWWVRYWEDDDDELDDECYNLRLRDRFECEIGDMCNVCEGDCDGDEDCKGNLLCYQRNADEPVPGCAGTGTWAKDYCYDPSSIPNYGKDLTYFPEECAPDRPCQNCEGDCDRDEDCFGNLRCYQRNGQDHIPGCNGSGIWAKDYCYDPNHNEVVETPSPTSAPITPPTSAPQPVTKDLVYFPEECSLNRRCNECEGDCDWDADCEGNLVCFQRNGFTTVRGCNGSGVENKDYCVQPPPPPAPSSTSLELVYLNPECSGNQPCQRCQGDCDGDDQCAGNLVCFQRNDYTPVPGCRGDGVQHKDYCVNPMDLPERSLKQLRNDCTDDNPCNLCEGDCDNNDHCAPGLECFQRWGYAPIPGCIGTGIAGIDYCYDPKNFP